MLIDLLNNAHLTPESCAALMGISPRLFKSWVIGQRDLPGYIIPELASVLGVSRDALATGAVLEAPAIWFKFRESGKLSDGDRELVLLIRRLGYHTHQLDCALASPNSRWQVLFKFIADQNQPHRQASPSIQGREAAKVLKEQLGLGYPRKTDKVRGNGDLIRQMLRNQGILLLEAPIPKSQIEGCSFYVGEPGEERPCLFINTYEQGWFRRNHVLAHELAHSIFDLDSDAASIDFRESDELVDVKEVRAEAFAAECFVSKEMLRHLQSMLGLQWDCLSDLDLASLVAYAQVDLKLILRSALDHGFVDSILKEKYEGRSISHELKQLTERALSTSEYAETTSAKAPSISVRMTTTPSRSLRLPVSYIVRVVDAVREGFISASKAAEMLMIDELTFAERFNAALEPVAA